MRTHQIIVAFGWLAFSTLTASAQVTAVGPEFEAASVRRLSEQERGPLLNLPPVVEQIMGFAGGPGSKDPGRISYSKVSLRLLLGRAYNMEPEQIVRPDWLDTERYTIVATLPSGTDAAGLRLMLQKLLTERFAISFHRDVKELAVYRLKVAKNGPRLKPAETLAVYKDDDERKSAMDSNARDGLNAQIARAKSGDFSSSSHMPRATTAMFAEMLSRNVDRPVRDMTQLDGIHSFELTWTPEGRQSTPESAPSIFIALQELGLRLEAGKESTELLVIDKIEKVPTSN